MWRLASIALVLFSPPAHADLETGDCPDVYIISQREPITTNCERQHHMSLGAGMASPSLTSTFIENPAGFIYNRQLKFHGSASKHDGAAPWKYSGMTANGGKFLGGGVGYHQYGRTEAGANSSPGSLVSFGLAGAIKKLNTAVGFTRVKVATIGGQNQVGTIFNPLGTLRVGVTAFDFFHGTPYLGAGATSFIGDSLALAVDTIGPRDFKGAVMKTSLGAAFGIMQATVGYGWNRGKRVTTPQVARGFSAGLGLLVHGSVRVLAYYNQVELYYLGITIAP